MLDIINRPLVRRTNITIGMDFELILNGSASSFTPGYIHIKNQEGDFGTDGQTEIVEVRTDYGSNVNVVVDDIRRILLRETSDDVIQLKILAGAYPSGNPIGAHIHFGNTRYDRTHYLQQTVSYTVGLLCLLFEPKPDGSYRRDRVNTKDRGDELLPYGQIDNWEEQDWGREFKQPFSFIYNPEFTRAMLCFAQLMAVLSTEYSFNIYDDNIYDIYYREQYSRAADFFMTNLFPMLENEDQMNETAIKNDGKIFIYSEQEIQSIRLLKRLVESRWSYPADHDIRVGWSLPEDRPYFIYGPNYNNHRLTTPKSLIPIYMRSIESDEYDVIISNFTKEQEKQLAKIAFDHNLRIAKQPDKIVDIYRCCPTINIATTYEDSEKFIENVFHNIGGQTCAELAGAS